MRSTTPILFLALAIVCAVAFLTPITLAQPNYTVTVSVEGLPSGASTSLYVDGVFNGTLGGGQSRSFSFGNSSSMHLVTVDFYVPSSTSNATRYYDKDTSWSFSSGGSHVFRYTTQYYLLIQSSYSTVQGQGWYDDGSTIQATVKDQEVTQGQETREVFTGWGGDASGAGQASNSITMNAPKKAVANWKTQFYLTVNSDPPSVNNLLGAGWYDANSQANFSAPMVVTADQDSRLSFTSWSGDSSTQSASGLITMDRPKVVTAHYIAQYLLTVQYDPASITGSFNVSQAGWHDANENVQLGPVPANIDVSSVERFRFLSWVVDGTPSTSASMVVTMDGAHKIVLTYGTQYYVTVTSPYGAVTGSGWYDKDATATITTSSTAGTWPFAYTFAGWTIDPSSGQLNQVDGSWTITVDRPYNIQAKWSFDYSPIILLIGTALAAVLTATAIALAYKRGILARTRPPRQLARDLGRGGRICSKCGNLVPLGAGFCEKCGNTMEVTPAPVSAPLTQPIVAANPLDDRVYDYIVKHEGVISMSMASSDLGISSDELKGATERLKKQGRLT